MQRFIRLSQHCANASCFSAHTKTSAGLAGKAEFLVARLPAAPPSSAPYHLAAGREEAQGDGIGDQNTIIPLSVEASVICAWGEIRSYTLA